MITFKSHFKKEISKSDADEYNHDDGKSIKVTSADNSKDSSIMPNQSQDKEQEENKQDEEQEEDLNRSSGDSTSGIVDETESSKDAPITSHQSPDQDQDQGHYSLPERVAITTLP